MTRAQADDTIAVGEVLGRIRRRWRWIAVGLLLGVCAAAGATALMPRRYDAVTRVLVRAPAGGEGSMLSRLGGLAGVIPGMGGGSEVETELLVMTSGSVLEGVVDSLGLQGEVLEPAETRVDELFSSWRFARDVEKPVTYRFVRRGGGFQVTGPGVSATARSGAPVALPTGVVTLRGGATLPDEFELAVSDMRDAVAKLRHDLTPSTASTNVAEIAYSATEPVLAARVPNLLVQRYVAQRATTGAGVDRFRYTFLVGHADSVRAELASAENALRRSQETSGFVDPEVYVKGEYERALTLQGESETLGVEMRALRAILAGGGRAPTTQELAAYPTFLRNPAINALLDRVLELRTKRVELLQRRTEEDPEVLALDASLRDLDGQLVSLSRSYLAGLERQSAEMAGELSRYQASLAALPAQAQENLRLQREVKRLSETLVALQTQSVQTRLAAMGEGGAVQQIDPAVIPREPSSPNVLLNLVIGLVAGTILGVVAALIRSYTDPRVRTARDAALAAGAPALEFDPRAPLLLAPGAAGVLVIPVGPAVEAGEVARAMVDTARMQGRSAELVELEAGAPRAAVRVLEPVGAGHRGGRGLAEPAGRNGAGTASPAEIRTRLAAAEGAHDLTVIALGGLDAPASLAALDGNRRAVLVARAGVVTRAHLRHAVDALASAGMEAAAVVLVRRRDSAGA